MSSRHKIIIDNAPNKPVKWIIFKLLALHANLFKKLVQTDTFKISILQPCI